MTASDSSAEGCGIAVFARAPVPGAVKTRLIPALGEARAAALQRALVRHALEIAVEAAVGPVELHCAPDADDPFFSECADRFGVSLATQSAGDLGARMLHACATLLETHPSVLLIGSDIPCLTADYLRRAAAALRQGSDAVLGPAADGGYVLIGLRRVEAALFQDIPWGGAEVLATTRQRLDLLGWRYTELSTLWDLDRPEDLSRADMPPVLRRIARGADSA